MAVLCSTSLYSNSTIEKAINRISELGFDSIDLLVIDGWVHVNTKDLVKEYNNTISKVEALLSTYNIKPIAVNSAVSSQLHHRSVEVNKQRIEETKALVAFMKYFNIKFAAIQPRNPDSTRHWKAIIDDCVETLKEQKAIGDSEGITFALEFHINSPFETMEQIKYFTQLMPEMPIVYDPSHFAMQGIDIKETEWILDKAVHIHLRDASEGKMQVPVGKGKVDFHWLLSRLVTKNYCGHISIEYLETKDFDAELEVLKLSEIISKYL